MCAANRKGTLIVASARHFDELMHATIAALQHAPMPGEWQQGFIDQFGEFMTRQEAWVVATAAEQIRRECNTTPGNLYSEHLY